MWWGARRGVDNGAYAFNNGHRPASLKPENDLGKKYSYKWMGWRGNIGHLHEAAVIASVRVGVT